MFMFCFFDQKTAYEMRISDWSADVCSSDLALYLLSTLFCALAQSFPMMLGGRAAAGFFAAATRVVAISIVRDRYIGDRMASIMSTIFIVFMIVPVLAPTFGQVILYFANWRWIRSEEHTSELQSLMRTSYADFCLKK